MDVKELPSTRVSLDRPRLDPELRPALVVLPDHVRIVARSPEGRRVVVVPRRTLAALLRLDRLPLWRDFDDLWDRVEFVALRVLRAKRYDRELDARTGVPRVVLEPSDFP
jgi:hypothetical protein